MISVLLSILYLNQFTEHLVFVNQNNNFLHDVTYKVNHLSVSYYFLNVL